MTSADHLSVREDRTVTSILDTIDNAIADCGVSADAMRWTPEPPPFADDASEVARLIGEGAESIWVRIVAAFEPLARQFAEAAEAFKGARLTYALIDEAYRNQRRPERVTRMRRAYRARRR